MVARCFFGHNYIQNKWLCDDGVAAGWFRRNRRAVTPKSPRVDGVMVGRKRGHGDEANRKNRGRNIGTYPACVRQPLSFFGQTDRMLLQFVDKSVICRALLCLSPSFPFRTYRTYVPTIIVRISYNYSAYILQLQSVYPTITAHISLQLDGEKWGTVGQLINENEEISKLV